MCYRFIVERYQFTVIYPLGDFSAQRASVSKLDNKFKALTELLRIIEAEWNSSFPNPKSEGQ